MIIPPSLDRLKNEQCSIDELQSAIVHLAELQNQTIAYIQEHLDIINSKKVLSDLDVIRNSTYGL